MTITHTNTPEWTIDHARASTPEGWDIFDCHGSMSGPWQVQSFDDPQEGEPDIDEMEAWRLVRRADTPHARAALAFLRVHNPLEHARIMAYPIIVHGVWDYRAERVEWGQAAVEREHARSAAELARNQAVVDRALGR